MLYTVFVLYHVWSVKSIQLSMCFIVFDLFVGIIIYPKNRGAIGEATRFSIFSCFNYLRMASMIPELEDLVATGIVISAKLRALISNNFGRKKNDPAKNRKSIYSIFCHKVL